MLKLYLISQNIKNFCAFREAVVVAKNSREARCMHPNGGELAAWNNVYREPDDWVNPENVHAKYIGDAARSIKWGEILISTYLGPIRPEP